MQFEILGKLRDIQNLIIKEEEDMALVDIYDMETDVRFMQGEERGLSKGLRQGEERATFKKNKIVVTNLLKIQNFSAEEIARLADVSTDFVKEIQNTLASSA